MVGMRSLLQMACDSSAVEGPILNKIFHSVLLWCESGGATHRLVGEGRAIIYQKGRPRRPP